MSDNVSQFPPKMSDTEAELGREKTLREAYSVQLEETKQERDRIEGKYRQLVEWLSNFADEWSASVDADDTAFEIVNDLREHLETLA